ncbi:hypothetical protein EDD21DRAFT_135494 [Dissophora ornata]|nr:hypothetical protein EDD21DRAFT_135494 [Dissophora ornata]
MRLCPSVWCWPPLVSPPLSSLNTSIPQLPSSSSPPPPFLSPFTCTPFFIILHSKFQRAIPQHYSHSLTWCGLTTPLNTARICNDSLQPFRPQEETDLVYSKCQIPLVSKHASIVHNHPSATRLHLLSSTYMALVSENPTAALGGMSTKNRISFREGLNDTRHYDEDDNGFSSDEDESEYEDDHDDTSKDPETAEIASMEKRALKYRRSITMLNKLAGMNQVTDHDDDLDDD